MLLLARLFVIPGFYGQAPATKRLVLGVGGMALDDFQELEGAFRRGVEVVVRLQVVFA